MIYIKNRGLKKKHSKLITSQFFSSPRHHGCASCLLHYSPGATHLYGTPVSKILMDFLFGGQIAAVPRPL